MVNELNFEPNEAIHRLPKHLRKFIIKQPYEKYTAQNHAVWRYVMRINVNYLREIAHNSYIEGLEKTGISIDKIPRMEEMNQILEKTGWNAVAVDGFIPPNAFLEFQAHNVLVIASNIRSINQIDYTPSPDIIHEASGHAPIISNPEYAEYLRRFGELGSKAISSTKDDELYEAVRLLSILKSNSNSSDTEINLAEENVKKLQENIGELSEMSKIKNLFWWTVEYGLIGSLENPKIYGAGLLSSIKEGKSCLQNNVQKILYSIEAANVNFDITKPQPQLFVTPNFAHLNSVLEEFADTMAIRKGGLEGLEKLINSKNIGTIELSSGIQISGIFSNVIIDDLGNPIYFQTNTATALAYNNKELVKHSTKHHPNGFGSPVGKLKEINISLEEMNSYDLKVFDIYEGRKTSFEFEGGIIIEGTIVTKSRSVKGKIILISLKDVTVTYQDQILFDPEWGIYDMAIGEKIISAFSGSADVNSFEELSKTSQTKTEQIIYSEKDKELFELYKQVEELRELNLATDEKVSELFEKTLKEYPDDWLLTLELYELTLNKNFSVEPYIAKHLNKLGQEDDQKKKLINQGLEVLGANLHEKLEWDYLTFLKKGTKQ